MITLSDIKQIIEKQEETLKKSDLGQNRDLLSILPNNLYNHTLIIAGIRRCGKSTLLKQFLYPQRTEILFLNFDIPKFYNFNLNHFELLDEIISENDKIKVLFFDEIQVVKGWEIYVRQKLDEQYRVVITGSNASLLSRELGTKLTGRHITKELYPFSLNEFCNWKQLPINYESFCKYWKIGGFPEYIKTQNSDILNMLINDIVYRDITVRHNIKNEKLVTELLQFLASNIGNLISATKITKLLSIKSPVTVLEYFSFFEQSYVLFLMPKFSYSYKKQMINPKKVYFIDLALSDSISYSYTEDIGRRLENLVFLELKRQNKKIFYYNENQKECDFVVFVNNKIETAIQVCAEINVGNRIREVRGLIDALNFFNIEKGLIITDNQEDKIIIENKKIEVLPFWKWVKNSNANIKNQ